MKGAANFAIYPDLMVRIRVKEDLIAPKFLVDFLLTPPSRAYFKKNASRTAGNMPKIDQGVIRRVKILLPLAEEQQEIVYTLRACDRQIQALEKEISTLDELFRAMLSELMTGRLSTQPLIK